MVIFSTPRPSWISQTVFYNPQTERKSMNKKFLFGAIASVIAINSVFADTIVTSKNYVDAADALKQNKIDATGANFTNGSVVETTSTPGVVTQRGIFNPETGFDENDEIVSGHEGDLVTVGFIAPILTEVFDGLPEDGFETTNATYTSCYEFDDNGECILWQLEGKIVYGPSGNNYFSPDGKASSCGLEGDYCGNNDACCSGFCQNNKCSYAL